MRAFRCHATNEPGAWVEHPAPTADDDHVVLRLHASGINYKDALAATGSAPILRHTPLTPGIDGAGTVLDGGTDWPPERVAVLTGQGSGEDWDGSWSEFQRVPRTALVDLGPGWDAVAAMAVGTAGFTAALALVRLRQVLGPDLRATPATPVAVTGASGGVGLWALRLCRAAAIPAVAISGKTDAATTALLLDAGARTVLHRDEALAQGRKPLTRERYAAVIDAAGGPVLAALLPQIVADGAAATAGVAAGGELPTTMYPFILRGVSLLGLASSHANAPRRAAAWQVITEAIDPSAARASATCLTPDQALDRGHAMLAGSSTGRAIITW